MPAAPVVTPDAIVIGAMKCGTTTLYEYMARHPQIGVSADKETDFFISEKNWPRGLAWYQGQFTPGKDIYVEASPNYTKREVFDGVPERIAAELPDCRFIFIARDPVRRAESHYRHMVLSGQNVPSADNLWESSCCRELLDASSYARQLAPYLALFPARNFLILDFDELISTPDKTLARVAKFLGVQNTWVSAEEIQNNSADDLARLPPWMFKLRESRAASHLRKHLSRDQISRLKTLVSRSEGRVAGGLDADLRDKLAASLEPDTAQFRALRGAVHPSSIVV